MKLILSFFFLVIFIENGLLAQSNYSRVSIRIDSFQLTALSQAGIPIEESNIIKENQIVIDLSSDELGLVKQLGIEFMVLIDDLVSFYQSQLDNNYELDRSGNSLRGFGCTAGGTIIDYPIPTNFSLGSMGGYLTYDEYIANLDSMASLYPSLITVKSEIDSLGIPFSTHDGNPVYWVRMSDNANVDENEPEILYTALHHAREPASLSQLIYYMWYLLENYGSDAEASYILDNMELYFIPMVNPDGYRHNELVEPGGGGMWRKNRRNNGGSYGVDLNRNYSYQWGVSGSSSNPSSNTYMGPASFSEPETRSIKRFCEDHDFIIAQNSHTHGDLLLYPFGYGAVQAADAAIFEAWTSHMVSQNGFGNMQSADLYPASGDSDDWMYDGDLATKPKIYAMTPEIGADNYGFWPPTNQIVPICKSMVFENLTAAHLMKVYGVAGDLNPQIIGSLSGFLKYDIQRLGLEAGPLNVSIAPVGFGISSVGTSNIHNLVSILDQETDSISYTLDGAMVAGQSFQYELIINNGSLSWRDTITKIFGSSSVVYSNPANSMADWTTNVWNITTADFLSSPTSIADSPFGNYSNYENASLKLTQSIDLTNALAANITFYTMWDIEDNYDYCQFQVSTDNGFSWFPMCGLYTQTGTSNQDPGEPVWDGVQSNWVMEEINLNDFLGMEIHIQYVMVSDGFVTGDGYYIDDFEIHTITANGIPEATLNLQNGYPNPTDDLFYLPLEGESNLKLQVMDNTGRIIFENRITGSQSNYQLNTSSWSSGTYFYRIISLTQSSTFKCFSIIK